MEQFLDIFSLSNNTIFILFAKAFAVLFSFLYLIYAVVMTRQTQVMNKTFHTRYSGLLLLISALQIILAFILIYVSIFLI
mgnify:CR=1 FL=1